MNADFALDLYRRQPAGNVFFSPHSISAAMAMMAAGARGETAAEIERAMRFPFSGAEAGAISANSIWLALDVVLRPEYVALVQTKFRAAIERVDFAKAAPRINAWVSDVTHGKIRDLVTPDDFDAETRAVLANAIYMKAAWDEPFSAQRTDEHGRFFGERGEVAVPLMTQTNHFRYLHDGGVRVLELPYDRNTLSMLIVLPDDAGGAIDVTPEALARWDASLAFTRVDVTLPRFHIELTLRLSDVLRAMGIRLAFDPTGAADFTGIAEEPLAISEVIHKARVDVDEKGTEAAAATAVVMRAGASFRPEPPEIFRADHPFFFAIRRTADKGILFLGRLSDPVQR